MARPNPDTEETLDRRRRALLKRTHIADVASRKLAEIEGELATNEKRTAQREIDLQAALDAVAALKEALKEALKVDQKQHETIRAARKDAREQVAEAQRLAGEAEAKYDRAVLEDMLRREKQRDLAAHSATAGRPASAGDRPTELPAGTQDEARKTQARTTAIRAHAATP